MNQEDLLIFPDSDKLLQEYASLKDVVDNIVNFLKWELLNKNSDKLYHKVEIDYLRRRAVNLRTKTPYRGVNPAKRTWAFDVDVPKEVNPDKSFRRAKIPKPISPRSLSSILKPTDYEDGQLGSPHKQESLRQDSQRHATNEYRKSYRFDLSNIVNVPSPISNLLRDDKHASLSPNGKIAAKNLPLAESRTECSTSEETQKQSNDITLTLTEVIKRLERIENDQKKIMEILSQTNQKVDSLHSIVTNLASSGKGVGGGTETGTGQEGEDKGGEKAGWGATKSKSARRRMPPKLVLEGRSTPTGGVQDEENI